MARIGFVINPIAGMGGRVGLKGTDDKAYEASLRGAVPIANRRAAKMLSCLRQELASSGNNISWFTASGEMGDDALREAGFTEINIVHCSNANSSAADTNQTIAAFENENVDLIVFCGGDGTARDICQQIGSRIPLLGIPSGVKMYSGVFGITPELTAHLILGFVEGRFEPVEVEVIDLDEEQYRKDEWTVRVYCTATTPYEPSLLPMAKAIVDVEGDATIKNAIAADLCERMRALPRTVFLLGPGTTVQAIARHLGVKKTLLGIDAVRHEKLLARNLNEKGLLSLLSKFDDVRLIISPIGAQGFLLGRGNLELSPKVLRKIGIENIIIVATPAKLARTPIMLFDTGDSDLNEALAGVGYRPVLVNYHRNRMVATGFRNQDKA